MTQSEAFVAEILSEFPKLKLVPKDSSWLMKFINGFLYVFGNRNFMSDYITTIGSTIYVCTKWNTFNDAEKITILRHERVHLRQAKKYSHLLFSFLYLFMFFPIGLAYFRAKFEKEAYTETIKGIVQFYGPNAVLKKEFRESIILYFTGPGYLWMWPFKSNIEKWFNDTREQVITEYLKGEK